MSQTLFLQKPTVNDVLDDLSVRFIVNCPAEDAESFERVFFQIELAHWNYVDFYVPAYGLPSWKLAVFARALFRRCPALQPFQAEVTQLLTQWKDYKLKVPVCGSILVNERLDKVSETRGRSDVSRSVGVCCWGVVLCLMGVVFVVVFWCCVLVLCLMGVVFRIRGSSH